MKIIGDQKREPKNQLPVHNKLTPVYIISIVSVVLIVMITISTLLNRDRFYPDEALILTFVPNDIVYLAIGIPMFLLSMVNNISSTLQRLVSSMQEHHFRQKETHLSTFQPTHYRKTFLMAHPRGHYQHRPS